MATTEERIAKAQELLNSGRVSPEKASELKRWVNAQYASGAAQRPSQGLGSPTAKTGAAAIEEVDEALPERVGTPASQDVAEQLTIQKYVREGQPNVTWSAPDAQLVQQTFQQQAGVDPAAVMREQAQMLRMEADSEEQRFKIKNLSKDPELYVPPEHWTQQSQLQPSIKDALPGIGHEVWEEPSLEMFRRDMSDMLTKAGLDPEKIDEGDPLYHRYADAMWAQRYKRAAEKGENVVRGSLLKGATRYGSFYDPQPGEFATDGDALDRYGAMAMDAINAVTKFGYGLDYGRTAGIATEAVNSALGAPDEVVADQRNMRETGWGQLGQLTGLLSPGGIAGGIASRLSAQAPKVTGIGANVVRGGVIGAKSGAAEVLLQDAVQNAGDVLRGNEPTVSLEQMGQRGALGAGLGAGLGGAFSGIGAAANWGKGKLLQSPTVGKDLANMEAAGIEPGIFPKLSEPAAVKAARQRTADAGLGGDVKSQASRELGPPLARVWRDVGELGTKGELPRLEYQVDGYLRSQEGVKKYPVNNTVDAVLDLLKSRKDADGNDLPFVLNMAKFSAIKDKLFDKPRVVTRSEAARLAEAGWVELPDARQFPQPKGSQLPEWLDSGRAEPELPQAMVEVARRRHLNARELLEVEQAVDDLAGFSDKALEGPKEKAYRMFARALRQDRDQFGFNGWTRGEGGGQLQMITPEGETVTGLSALMGRLSEAKRASRKLRDTAGLTGPAPALKSVVSEQPVTPTKLGDVRQSDKALADIDEVALGPLPAQYDPTGASPRSAARRMLDREHEKYVNEKVLAGLSPEDVRALEMFSLGYDTPIRMVQRGISPEEATRRYYDPSKTDLPPHEFTKRISEASARIEGILARSPKATHVPVVYRGAVFDDFQINRMLEEGSFNNGGQVSSFSRNPMVTAGFGGSQSGTAVTFKVRHKNGVGIETLSEIPQEQEVLLPGSSSFKITDAYWAKGPGRRLIIEAQELSESTVGKAPKARSAVKEKLGVQTTAAQDAQADKLIQTYRQNEGTARGDEAALEMARLGGFEEELKMWAGIFSANRVASGREGIAASGSGIRGWLAGGLPQLAVRTTRPLNRLGAEPLAHAPSTELRALLRRLRGKDGPSGPPAFSLMGMGSGGPPIAGAFVGQEREPDGLNPALRAAVMGKEHLREQPMTPEEVGWLRKLAMDVAEAAGRGIGAGMPAPAPQQSPAPMAPPEEYP